MSNKDLAKHLAAYVNGHMDPRVFGDVCRDVNNNVIPEEWIAEHVVSCCGTRERRKRCILTDWIAWEIQRSKQ